MATKYPQWNTTYETIHGVIVNRGQDVYLETVGGIHANPPKFGEDLNAEEE